MIKTGICNINQFDELLQIDTSSIFAKKISITLYDQLASHPKANVLSEQILRSFADDRGAYKRTYENRFEKFDKKVTEIIRNQVHSQGLKVHDVAVSDGRTAVDFYSALEGHFNTLDYTASDYNPILYVVEKYGIKLVLDSSDNILEISCPPFVFNRIKRDSYKHYPLNHLIQFMLENSLVKLILLKYKLGLIGKRELCIFSYGALKLAEEQKNFRLKQHNILNPLNEKVNVIRAMNILNTSYFSQPEFKKIVKNIIYGLDEGGLLIAGSNQDPGSVVDGAVYKKEKHKLHKVWSSGSGCQIDNLLLSFEGDE